VAGVHLDTELAGDAGDNRAIAKIGVADLAMQATRRRLARRVAQR
jgi:hypothetical protein